MNIDEMTDEEKSIILARLIGLEIDGKPPAPGYVIKCPRGSWTSNLYHPQNMELAWMVLNWASDNLHGDDWHTPIGEWVWGIFPTLAWLRPAHAQRVWLDKVLELAVELGKVKAA